MNISVSGMHIHYEEVGDSHTADSTPTIFIHGWGGSSRSLASLAQTLAPSVRGYLIDLPGFGHSSDPPPSWGVSEYAQCVQEFVKEAGLVSPVSIVGHSFGGSIALYLAAHYPQLVAKIVVCAPSWHRHTASIVPSRHVSKMLHHFPLVRRVLYRVLFPRSDLMRYPKLEQNFKKIVREDLSQSVRTIGQNVLIIWGKDDTYVPVTDAVLLHELLPQSILRVYPGMRHDLPLTHSDLITDSIRVFLTTKTRI